MLRSTPATAPLTEMDARDAAPARPQGAAESSLPARAGVLFGVAAYGLWGVFPLYFKAIRNVPPLEVLAHRIIWSLAFLSLLLLIRRHWRSVVTSLRQRRTVALLAATTLLIAANWLVFIWAVTTDHVLQASLGYFINPLVNVVFGVVFLRERLRDWQKLSVALAAIGVGYLTIASGQFPLVALFLAITFGMYGLLRKIAQVESLVGLTIETALLTPAALAHLAWQMVHGTAVFGASTARMNVLLLLAGVVTATPLLCFTAAARRLKLATLGFLQYLAPTGHFLCAVFAFDEPFSSVQAIAFAFIWTALLVYSADAARAQTTTSPVID